MLMNVMKFDKFLLSLSPLDSKSSFVPIIIAHVVLFLAHGTLLYISKSWNIEFRTCLVKRKKNGVFSINFQFFVEPTTKKLVWLCFYTQYSFFVLKKWIWIQKMNTTFGRFYFKWKWIQWHSCKNIKLVVPK